MRSATLRARTRWPASPEIGLDQWAAATSCGTCASKPRPGARCPTTARSSSSASATRSAIGASASSRRSARGARAVGDRDRGSPRRAARPAGRGACGPTTASCCACRRRSTTFRSKSSSRARGDRRARRRSTLPTSSLFASRFRECAARALLLPRRRPGRAHASLAAAATGRRPPRRRVEAPELPGAARDDTRVPARRVRRARAALGAEPTCVRGRSGWCRSRPQASPFAQ